MNKITVESCSDCPFYYDDSDNGPTCNHGVNIDDYRMEKEDKITVRHGVGGCVISSIPKKCPLLMASITVEISEIYRAK